MQITPSGLVFLVSWIGAAYCAVYTWRRRKMPGGYHLSSMMAAVAWWSLCAFFENVMTAFAMKVFWSTICYVGIASVAPLWFLFTLRYCRRDRWLKPWVQALLWIIPVATLVAALTNDTHRLVWNSVTVAPNLDESRLVYDHGPVVWIDIAYSYSLILAGTILFIHTMLRSPPLMKRQYGTIIGAVVSPWICHAVYVSGLGPSGLDITPLAFTLTSAFMAWGLVRYHILDVVPIAHDMLFSCMSDGVLVIDEHGRIVNINPAALGLLGTKTDVVGRRAAEVLQKWPDIAECLRAARDGQTDVKIEIGEGYRWIDTRMSALVSRHGQALGSLYLLRDVTARKRLEDELLQHATTDILTGVFNRRMGLAVLEKQLRLVRRSGNDLAVCFADIDNLKTVNDALGHIEGDRLIVDVAAALKDSLRELDSLCRLGGDEFLVIMPHCSAEQARAFMGRVESNLARINAEGDRPFTRSVSFGFAESVPGRPSGADELVARADEEMYKDKQRRKALAPKAEKA